MCGRFTHLFSWSELCRLMGLLESAGPPPGFARRYNIAPTQDALVVRRKGEGPREVLPMRWGLVPWWAEDLSFGNRAINARAESASGKPAFREAMAHRRCLVPASGFYEWQKLEGGEGGKRKQAWYVKPGGDEGCAFAGLWERWKPKDAPEGEGAIRTFTILTTKANDLVSPLHDRMPVVVARERFDEWLDPSVTDAGALRGLLESREWPEAEAYPVSNHVNRPANEDPLCVRPLVEEPGAPGEGPIEPGLFG